VKAEVAQQRSLLEVAELDAELNRAAHRVANLVEQQHFDQVQADHRAATDDEADRRPPTRPDAVDGST